MRSCASCHPQPRIMLTAQHTLVRIRACHERQYRANVHERVQRVDCVDRAFLIVCVIIVTGKKDDGKKKKKKVTTFLGR